MNSKLWIRRALSACLSVSLLATYSMVALASPKTAGELLVSGSGISGEAPTVFVNGETARSGRSVFSSSTIVTPENASAVVSFGKLGKVEIAPNSAFTVNFDDKTLSGDLTAGKLTVLTAAEGVSVRTQNNAVKILSAGQSILATGTMQQDDDDDDGFGGAAWWAFAAVMVAAGAVIIYAATNDNDRISLGGAGTVISPTR